MKIMKRINDYLIDKEYKIIVKDNQVSIVNYNEILDFTLEKISIRHNNKKIIIEGKNLYISKMLEDEVLIKGIITIIRIN